MIPVAILGSGSAFLGRAHDTRTLASRAFPRCEPEDLEVRTGIRSRYWVEPGTSTAELAATALAGALERASLPATALRRIILVTSTGGDHMIPATANDVAAALSLDGTCDAFDLNNSCVGFLSAFDVAARAVATGLEPIGVVAAETFSRQLSPEGPRAYVTLGDGAGAVILGRARGEEGLLACALKNSAALRGRMDMAHPGTPGARPYHDFSVDGHELAEVSLVLLKQAVSRVLEDAACPLADISWWLPHQPNGTVVRRLVRDLQLDADRLVPIVDQVGSIGAASVPVSLDRLLRSGRVGSSHTILMAAAGAGMASGALLYRAGR